MCKVCPRTPVNYVSGLYTQRERGSAVGQPALVLALVGLVRSGQERRSF